MSWLIVCCDWISIGFGSALSSVLGKLNLVGNPSDAESEAQRDSGKGEMFININDNHFMLIFIDKSKLIFKIFMLSFLFTDIWGNNLRFHSVHGKAVILQNDSSLAIRDNRYFEHSILFSHRPVTFDEIVSLI